MRAPGIPLLPFSFLDITIALLIVAIVIFAILALFKSNISNRLSTRITVLIFAFGLVIIMVAVAFNFITSDTLSPIWLRQLQRALIVLGGPVVLGAVAARFVRRPLRQFNDAIASLEKQDSKVQLQPTGIREFDEVFAKFNNLTSRLQQEEKLRKDLVSDTSHELKTPLTVMIGQLTAIQEGKYPMTEERVSILKEQAERLAELVEQLDAYTRARMPASDEPKEDIHLKQFCEELISHFSLELKEKGIATKLEITEEYVLHANRGALHQILTNLIQNTVRYSGATELTMTATAHELTISDNGKGVPAESLLHLFERFYRVEKSRNRAAGGLGLGLAIVRELTESQGWNITAAAGHPGLTFTIKIKK